MINKLFSLIVYMVVISLSLLQLGFVLLGVLKVWSMILF